ncbi:MAG: HDOD domain-containing protein [Rhodocyclaceae bacterium]|nr:HDOD domain-containing protein [Rhodocyclaceae bacterium]
MSSSDLFLIHPLLGATDAWAGYLVEAAAPSSQGGEAIQRLCSNPLLNEFDLRHLWFIPPAALQSERFVTVFPTHGTEIEKSLEASLRQARHKVAAKLSVHDKLPATGTWDYLLIGAGHARTLPPYSLLGLSSRTILVATDIQSHADHQWAQANACSLTTSEFLMTRTAVGKKADVTRLKLLEMLGLIAEDANTDALEAIFRQESKLSYSLLRLVNSAANAPRTPITSFTQAINLLGRRQLQRWLQLLVYADPNNGQHPNPLLQKAAARGRLMEIMSSQLGTEPGIEYMSDAAFMVGSFSLLDVLLNMSMGEILQQLTLPEPVRVALLAHQGQLGGLLKLINSAEARDFSATGKLIAAQPFDATAYVDAQLQALSWAAKINPIV